MRAFKSCDNLAAGAHPPITQSAADIVMALRPGGESFGPQTPSVNRVGGERVDRGSLAMKGVTIGTLAKERRQQEEREASRKSSKEHLAPPGASAIYEA